jgi:hypothetical protein
MTITEFLLARIAEDETEARAMLREYERGGDASSRRWRRVLAECEAKRRIVGFAQSADEADRYAAEVIGGVDGAAVDTDGAGILRALASVYADHPDFDPAWRAE